jgi:site-specific recombinase XerD
MQYNTDPIKLPQAGKMLGINPETLRKQCNRGKYPGAIKIMDGKQEVWAFPPAELQRILKGDSEADYTSLHAEWIRRMERGLGYKKPVSPRGVEANLYGLEKFWLFVEDPPKEIRSGRRKGEEKAVPKRKPNINDMTLENLCIAIANVPLDRVNRKCHFSLKEKMYNGFRSFFKFLVAAGHRTRAQLADLVDAKPVRIYEERREFMTEEQLMALLEKNENLITGRHDADYDAMATKVIILLSAFVGLRLDDIVQLEIGHIDLSRQELVVVDGKGNKTREVGFNNEVREAIHLWKTIYRPKSRNQKLLIQKDGDSFTDDMVYKRLRRLGTAPHVMRRTCASIALEKGVPLHHISEMFGHTRTSTTEKSYVKVHRRQAMASFKSLSIGKESSKARVNTVDLIDTL